jgi:hypothetical protein
MRQLPASQQLCHYTLLRPLQLLLPIIPAARLFSLLQLPHLLLLQVHQLMVVLLSCHRCRLLLLARWAGGGCSG